MIVLHLPGLEHLKQLVLLVFRYSSASVTHDELENDGLRVVVANGLADDFDF